MRTRSLVALVAILVAVASGPQLLAADHSAGGLAEAPEHATHAAAPEHAGGAGAHAMPTGACGEDHWSIFDTLAPALRHNVCGALGETYLQGDPVGRGIHMVMAAVVMLLALGFAVGARRTLRRKELCLVPQRKLSFFVFFELLTEMLLDMMAKLMGEKKARTFLPLIGSLAVFILFSNLLGAIPGLLPPTDNLNTTFALGTVVFVATHYSGVRAHGPAYLKHFLGPIIKWYALPLMIIMLFIEVISHLVRPASLAVRLMGNIFGDHKVLGIFLGFHLLFVPLPIQVLGLLVAIVQTLVFCLLSIVYISMAVEHAEEHH